MELIDFIIKAKLSGYATGGESQEQKFEDGSLGFVFENEGYKYIDRYYGFNPFSGTEHLYNNENELIWKMNYWGLVIPNSSDPKKIYSFLSDAMSLITIEYPFRGPPIYEKNSLKYTNRQMGSFESFNGVEQIFEENKKVYDLYYHGGTMQQIT